ncbi:hypothetical protein MTR67_038860 [Solanum verrucosum]|uniref:Integrase zinc-binding domain-containing protein n=1 Tax=Solanum verrucosum TaxID=315347 RepID=A0AAF0UFW5_SOLVR|nr:hypothetical protein MTR67_038860 [Solanum verrucosum]
MTFEQGKDVVLRYQGTLCVPMVDDLLERIMAKAHSSRYSIHSGSTKMYHDLRDVYWWSGMKMCIAKFVANCPNCQQVKLEHQRPNGVAQNIVAPEWKKSQNAIRSPSSPKQTTVGSTSMLIAGARTYIMKTDVEFRMSTKATGESTITPEGPAQCQHEYAGKINSVDDLILQAIVDRRPLPTTSKWVVGNITYELKLPSDLAAIHLVFDISMFKKYMGDPSLIVPNENIGIKDILSYEEVPIEIPNRHVRKLRTKEVASVKVLWRNQFFGRPSRI